MVPKHKYRRVATGLIVFTALAVFAANSVPDALIVFNTLYVKGRIIQS